MDAKQLRSIIKEEVTGVVQTQLEPIKKDLKGLRGDVDSLTGDVGELREDVNVVKRDVNVLKKDMKELSENVDAARGDIEHLHMNVKGIRDKESLFHSRNKREIDEIKTHLNMPLIPDVPGV